MQDTLDDREITRLKAISKEVRKDIVEMTMRTGNSGAHIGGSLSIVELLTVLYVSKLRYYIDDMLWKERDRVILSKGHAAMALYALFAEIGIIKKEELKEFKMDGGRLSGHPALNGLPGIEFASGSLGQGLSLGVGVSIALKHKGLDTPKVYVLLGDGECNEGSIWEAALSASHFGCDNLVAIIDRNNIQYDGYTVDVMSMDPIEDKWKAFGWKTITVNGHNVSEICKAYNSIITGPTVIIADTIKGKGISFMENNPLYHNAVLTKEQYEVSLLEIENG